MRTLVTLLAALLVAAPALAGPNPEAELAMSIYKLVRSG